MPAVNLITRTLAVWIFLLFSADSVAFSATPRFKIFSVQLSSLRERCQAPKIALFPATLSIRAKYNSRAAVPITLSKLLF